MRRIALRDFFFRDRDIQVDLLKGADMVLLSILEVLDWSHHPSFAGEEVQSRILTTMRLWDITDLQIKWDVLLSFRLPYPQSSCHLLTHGWTGPSYDTPIKLDTNVLTSIDASMERLGHA